MPEKAHATPRLFKAMAGTQQRLDSMERHSHTRRTLWLLWVSSTAMGLGIGAGLAELVSGAITGESGYHNLLFSPRWQIAVGFLFRRPRAPHAISRLAGLRARNAPLDSSHNLGSGHRRRGRGLCGLGRWDGDAAAGLRVSGCNCGLRGRFLLPHVPCGWSGSRSGGGNHHGDIAANGAEGVVT